MKQRIALLSLFTLLLWLLQALLMPKYTGAQQDGSLIGEYYSFSGGNDVIFLGDCEVYENFSPITLWEEYGIPSCIRGSPQQTIWQSYYLLEEIFRYETPKAVVFNVLSMKYDSPESTGQPDKREAYNRMTLDGMRWSASKWKAILVSMTEEERQWDSLFSYLFPILRYHDRWNQLTWEDVRFLFHRERISHNGYLMQTGIQPVMHAYTEAPLADYRFGETSYEYLEKIHQLCDDHGSQLILIKAPSLSPVWYDAWDAQINAFAQEKGLVYVNMLSFIEEIGIDWNSDTYDAGLHLNVYGAEKAYHWFGQILSENLGLPDRRQNETLAAVWSEKAARYYEEKQCKE